MAQYRNANGGAVVLPDGVEIANGAVAEISDDMAKSSGVAELIGGNGLVPVKTEKPAKAS
jgi:hypothetical protein